MKSTDVRMHHDHAVKELQVHVSPDIRLEGADCDNVSR